MKSTNYFNSQYENNFSKSNYRQNDRLDSRALSNENERKDRDYSNPSIRDNDWTWSGRGLGRGRGREGNKRNNSRGRGRSFSHKKNEEYNDIIISEKAVDELYIKGINHEANEDDLKETFNKYGTITSCKILKDKETQKSTGAGFVKFANKKSAVRALRDAENLICKGRNVVVRFANDKKREFKGKKKCPSGLNQNHESNEFNNAFSNNENKRNEDGDREKCGKVRGRVKGRGKGGDRERPGERGSRSRVGLRGNERGRSRRSRGRGFVRDNNNKKNFNNSNKDEKGWGSFNNRERSRRNKNSDKENDW